MMSTMRQFLIWLCIMVIGASLAYIGWSTIFAQGPQEIQIHLPENLSRIDIARIVGKKLNWDNRDIAAFASTYAQMQWAEYNTTFVEILAKKFTWTEEEREIFLIHSTKYFTDPAYDFFGSIYFPDTYTIMSTFSMAEIAGLLIEQVRDVQGLTPVGYIESRLSPQELTNVHQLVKREYELLPDLVPLPPHDIRIDKVDDAIRMSFTTVYYNQGRGPLELRADPQTAGIRKDIERDMFQRIYRPDGSYRDQKAGTFLWHQPHLHYHFADFIVYDLEAVDVRGEVPDLSGVLQKSTFCIRDVSKIQLDLVYREENARYEICGKEKQGISVGWGDAYFYTYPDQSLNITNLPSGTYRLTFIANPGDRFEEITKDNNTSSALIEIDTTALKVKVLEHTPKHIPEFEHVYPVQENCAACTL